MDVRRRPCDLRHPFSRPKFLHDGCHGNAFIACARDVLVLFTSRDAFNEKCSLPSRIGFLLSQGPTRHRVSNSSILWASEKETNRQGRGHSAGRAGPSLTCSSRRKGDRSAFYILGRAENSRNKTRRDFCVFQKKKTGVCFHGETLSFRPPDEGL